MDATEEACPSCGWVNHADDCEFSEKFHDEVVEMAVSLNDAMGAEAALAKARDLEELGRGAKIGNFWRAVAESIENATREPAPKEDPERV